MGNNVLMKLDMPDGKDVNRRVLAVLPHLGATPQPSPPMP
jgi:hypothetical protein